MQEILIQVFSDDVRIALAVVFILMVMNSSLMAPPSELICIAAGYWAAQFGTEWIVIAFVAALGNLLGTSAWFHLGLKHERAGQVGLPHRTKRPADRVFLFFTRRDVNSFLALFRRTGWLPVFVLRLLPLVRSIISYAAGRSGMRKIEFYVWSFLGILIWCSVWSWAGHHYGSEPNRTSILQIFVVFVAFTLAVWAVRYGAKIKTLEGRPIE